MKTKYLVTAAIIAALYVVLSVPFGNLSTNPIFQIRPSEALTVLPLLFPPAIIGLTIGCAIANIPSAFGVLDVILGSLVTLAAAFLTKKSKNVWIGGIFPVMLNAILLPIIFIIMGDKTAYFVLFSSILLTQTVWVYGLGIPLYYFIKKRAKKNS